MTFMKLTPVANLGRDVKFQDLAPVFVNFDHVQWMARRVAWGDWPEHTEIFIAGGTHQDLFRVAETPEQMLAVPDISQS